jgi:hypothetical protein
MSFVDIEKRANGAIVRRQLTALLTKFESNIALLEKDLRDQEDSKRTLFRQYRECIERRDVDVLLELIEGESGNHTEPQGPTGNSTMPG